jgi:hypothetical protein
MEEVIMKKIVCMSFLLLNLVACTDHNPPLHDAEYYKENVDIGVKFLITDCQKVEKGDDDNLAKNCRTARDVMQDVLFFCSPSTPSDNCKLVDKNSKLIFRKY